MRTSASPSSTRQAAGGLGGLVVLAPGLGELGADLLQALAEEAAAFFGLAGLGVEALLLGVEPVHLVRGRGGGGLGLRASLGVELDVGLGGGQIGGDLLAPARQGRAGLPQRGRSALCGRQRDLGLGHVGGQIVLAVRGGDLRLQALHLGLTLSVELLQLLGLLLGGTLRGQGRLDIRGQSGDVRGDQGLLLLQAGNLLLDLTHPAVELHPLRGGLIVGGAELVGDLFQMLQLPLRGLPLDGQVVDAAIAGGQPGPTGRPARCGG